MSSLDKAGDPIQVAVVTGRHPFDVVGLAELFRRLDGIDAYIQHMEDFAADVAQHREKFDVVLYYNMHGEAPSGEVPWYDKSIREEPEKLGATTQGIFVLHHALLAYLDWPLWSQLVGMEDRSFGFHHDQTLMVRNERPDHPITQELSDWEMVDETYTMADPGSDCEVLLTADHPKSMRVLAWTRHYRNSRVFCFQSGHDNQTWVHPSFREVVHRGLLWCAQRI